MTKIVEVVGERGQDDDPSDFLAKIATDTRLLNAGIAMEFSGHKGDSMGIENLVVAIADKAKKAVVGDMSEQETMLASQAIALDVIFNRLACKANANLGTNITAAEKLMRLALKAQGQCRTTIESLAEIKNPRSITITKQANIAGQQVVNNGVMAAGNPHAHAHAGENKNDGNELEQIGKIDHATLDTRITPTPIGENAATHTSYPSVAELNRAENDGGQDT